MHPYATHAYSQSLRHIGEPIEVPAWHSSLIRRHVNAHHIDACGPYPLTKIAPEADIDAGLKQLTQLGAVSLTMVLDAPNEALATQATIYKPYKTHYIFRPELGDIAYSTHHKRALCKAQGVVDVNIQPLSAVLNDWCRLYDGLIKRHNLSGVHAFEHAHHQALSQIDGFIAACGYVDGKLEACHLWVAHDGEVISHLVTASEVGQQSRAGFLINDVSIKHFAHCHTINFGGGAGLADNADDGLARFKRGFANDTKPSFLCGIILDQTRYDALTVDRTTNFFPAYRA